MTARPKNQDVLAHPDGERLAVQAVPRALKLIQIVREEGAYDVAQLTDPMPREELLALAVVLAGMVDIEKSVKELLAWLEPVGAETATELRGAHAAYKRGERDLATIVGEREYQHQRHIRRRSARKGAA